jgi:hypothetical protein
MRWLELTRRPSSAVELAANFNGCGIVRPAGKIVGFDELTVERPGIANSTCENQLPARLAAHLRRTGARQKLPKTKCLAEAFPMTPLESVLKSKLPRCLDGINATAIDPPESRDCTATAFSLSPKSSGDVLAKVLGYPLGDYNPSCKNDPDFIGPLMLQWSDGSESCVFDSDIHGYHGEMDSSAKLRGSGSPRAFACGKCSHDRFRVMAQFDYWDACDNLLEDEPDLPVQDYFCNIIFFGVCARCGGVNRILDMDL